MLGGEPGDEPRHVDVGEDHVGRAEIVAEDGEHGVRQLALVRRAGHAHLQDVQGLEPRPLRLRLHEVVGIGEREADVRRDVLQQPDVRLLERRFLI